MDIISACQSIRIVYHRKFRLNLVLEVEGYYIFKKNTAP
jgi:hypothetical protein